MLYYWICWQAEIVSLAFPFLSREFVKKTTLTSYAVALMLNET